MYVANDTYIKLHMYSTEVCNVAANTRVANHMDKTAIKIFHWFTYVHIYEPLKLPISYCNVCIHGVSHDKYINISCVAICCG